MTNGRGAAMASFMTKKKKYKFQVDVVVDELLEVSFVSAVLFAKLRLLDGGSFQDHSSREEVRDHTVKWGAKFSFPCKMLANASTGVLERCVLRISVRKECKGGRSYTKLGFVDINLAEYAGAGDTSKKALLEGYDTRHRQDNSMLRFSIKMNMLSGDILFKVPSPSLKHKPVAVEEVAVTEPRGEEFSGGSLAGSIASGSSGFGSLTKKRTALLSSDLVIGHTLTEGNVPVTIASEAADVMPLPVESREEVVCEHGHSRNSSNTSQLSKASGYSSIHSHSHSRQSSSGDSGHIRPKYPTISSPPFPKMSFPLMRTNTYPTRFLNLPTPSPPGDEFYGTPNGDPTSPPRFPNDADADASEYHTPKAYKSQISNLSTSSAEEYRTPEGSVSKSTSTQTVVELRKICPRVDPKPPKNMSTIKEMPHGAIFNGTEGVFRSKSDYEIPRTSPKSSGLWAFLTPHLQRRNSRDAPQHQSTPLQSAHPDGPFKVPGSPIEKQPFRRFPETRAASLCSLRLDGQHGGRQRGMSHRKLLEGSGGGKLAPVAISPDETCATVPSSDCVVIRRPSVTTNPSSSSLVLSETGSLDRAKAALERRKKAQVQDSESVPGRVEVTRVNPDELIADLLKNTNLEQADDSAETSGLQLFIAKDGTAALGNHEVKSQMSTGVQVFKQVVMDDNR